MENKKETDLAKRSELVEARLDEIEQIKARELDKMETIAGLTAEDAKQLLLNRLDEQLTHEKAMHIAAFETQTKDECDTMARELISQAVARCAADHSSEATVSVVPLPSDEMKGRIIGREGRNIRALETATGVDLIIDDTPEAITLSSFDPVRREVHFQIFIKDILCGFHNEHPPSEQDSFLRFLTSIITTDVSNLLQDSRNLRQI